MGVTVISGNVVDDLDFGNFRPISLSGQVFEDHNGDAFQDTGEPGIAGVVIVLDPGTDGAAATAVTNPTGGYRFDGVLPGQHTVLQQVPTDLVQTFPSQPGVHEVTVISGNVVDDLHFGNFRPISLSGQVFEDLNGDRVKDSDEPGIAGVVIELDSGTDGAVELLPGNAGAAATAVTNSTG